MDWSVKDGADYRLCVRAVLPEGWRGSVPGASVASSSDRPTGSCRTLMPDTHDGGGIGILEMMGRASGTYHWQFFVILKRSSRRQQDLGFVAQHCPAQQTVFPTRPTTRSNTCAVELQSCCHWQHCSGGAGG